MPDQEEAVRNDDDVVRQWLGLVAGRVDVILSERLACGEMNATEYQRLRGLLDGTSTLKR